MPMNESKGLWQKAVFRFRPSKMLPPNFGRVFFLPVRQPGNRHIWGNSPCRRGGKELYRLRHLHQYHTAIVVANRLWKVFPKHKIRPQAPTPRVLSVKLSVTLSVTQLYVDLQVCVKFIADPLQLPNRNVALVHSPPNAGLRYTK